METDSSRLIAQLEDPSAEQRLAAAKALAEFELLHAQTFPALIALLQDRERDVRLAAVASLMKIWRALTGAMGDVLATKDEIDEAFGPLNKALLATLDDEDKYVRLSAAEGLRDLFSTETKLFEVLVSAARDGEESLRRRAALALWLGASDRRATLFQTGSETGVAVLMELLQDQSQDVRGYALRAVASLGPAAKAAAPILNEILRDEDEDMRFKAALALASFGSGGEAAVPILADALAGGDRLKRKAAAFALRSMGSEAKPALPALIKGLRDQEKRVRARCASTLGMIGAAVNDDAIHALLEAERDDEPDVRLAVERALAAIGKENVEAAQKRATDFEARNFFPLFGFKPEEIPGLIFMLKDPNGNVRAMAATALGNLGAREAISDLLPLLDDEDADVRQRAANSLESMGVSTAIND
jgi:HEAT repeat protein